MGRFLRHAPAALALLAIAGCGSATTTVTVGGPPPATQASSSAAKSPTSTASGRVLHLSGFRSPTGNIGCMLLDGSARCDIARRSWSPPPRPGSCPGIVDFGQGLEMSASAAPGFVCAGDTVRDPASPTLDYGVGTRVGAFLCASSQSGMTCTRSPDGHGFFLSIQSYRIF